ncbi:MAG: helix-turn-helix transcriptional regulator [Thermodesulfobacteriota bacterium]|jgi:ribosome-binding protein aMBF1 (putative translation factor)
MATDRDDPVPFDAGQFVAERLEDPAFRSAYEATEEEFAALDVLLEARHKAGLSQEQVAVRMGMKQSSLARIESSLTSRKHAPSLSTLRRYAEALGCELEIRLVSKP